MKACRDCKYWEPVNPVIRRGKCPRLCEDNALILMHDELKWVITYEDFYCAHWEEKDGE